MDILDDVANVEYICSQGTLTFMVKVNADRKHLSKRSKFRSKNPNLLREGESNRNAYYQLILQHPEGLYPREIDSLIVNPKDSYFNQIGSVVGLNVKPSKQTRVVHLTKLMDEGRIYKKDGKYFPTDPDLSFIIDFAKTMRQASGLILSPHHLVQHLNDPVLSQVQIYPDWQVFTGSSSDKLHRSAESPTLSPSLGVDYRKVDSVQKHYFLHFAFRIGAYITYIFLESMRLPTRNLKIKNEKQRLEQKKKMFEKLLLHSIDLEAYLKVFQEYTEFLNLRGGTSKLDFELAFKELFPSFYEGLENFYKDDVFDHTNNLEMEERYSNPKFYCSHRWEEFHIFKMDNKYYYCSKCRHMVGERRKKEAEERQLKGKILN